jgi:hypothetical protein
LSREENCKKKWFRRRDLNLQHFRIAKIYIRQFPLDAGARHFLTIGPSAEKNQSEMAGTTLALCELFGKTSGVCFGHAIDGYRAGQPRFCVIGSVSKQ